MNVMYMHNSISWLTKAIFTICAILACLGCGVANKQESPNQAIRLEITDVCIVNQEYNLIVKIINTANNDTTFNLNELIDGDGDFYVVDVHTKFVHGNLSRFPICHAQLNVKLPPKGNFTIVRKLPQNSYIFDYEYQNRLISFINERYPVVFCDNYIASRIGGAEPTINKVKK